MGGFFMHSRPGILTQFLSEEWFAAIAACVEEAESSGMEAWLYDEWSFPSGFAGGAVTETRPELARRWLLCRPWTAPQSDDTLKLEQQRSAPLSGDFPGNIFVITKDDYIHVEGADPDQVDAVLSQHKGIALEVTLQKDPGSNWLGGFPYPDLLSRDTAQYFLQLAYEPYRERFAHHFGKTIPGMFTDEPHINPGNRGQEGAALPWTPALFPLYRDRYGESLETRVIELFVDVGQYATTRHRYWRLITELFIESWMKPTYEWCDRHGLKLTGHLWEHEFNPINSGSIMAPLEYMHYPGLDLLGRDVATFRQPLHGEVPHQLGDVAMVKAVTSVGHQLGRERILSETYGAGGYEMSFETQKTYGEWEFALGVTLLNQHLSHYSLRGYRKTDFPISFLDVQPWWSEYRALSDHFGRLSYALSQGTFDAQLLVLHPMATIWAEWTPASQQPALRARARGDQRVKNLAVTFDHLLKTLSAHNWGYDLGDDLIIERHGAIDTAIDGKPRCRVGHMQYQAVVIPPSSNLSTKTVEWLQDLADAGGTIFALTPLPTMVDGEPVDLSGLFSRCVIVRTIQELLVVLKQKEDAGTLARTVYTSTSTVNNPIYTHVKRAGDDLIVFLANVGTAAHLSERIFLRGTGVVERLCLSTGATSVLPAMPEKDGLVVELDFEKGQSHLLRLSPAVFGEDVKLDPGSRTAEGAASFTMGPSSSHQAQPTSVNPAVTVRSLPDKWQFRRLDPNVLVLDRLHFRIGDGPWEGPVFTAEAARILRERYGVNPYLYWDIQPFRKFGPEGPKEYDEEITFRYRVLSQITDIGDLELVVEDAGCFDIVVNGHVVHERTDRSDKNGPTNGQGSHPRKPAKPGTPWIDEAFRRLPIGHAWKAGENIIELTFRFNEDLPLEQSYLLGSFALASDDGRNFVLTEETQELKGGPWIAQGYPFFVGKARYSQKFRLSTEEADRRVFVDLSDLSSIARVFCNGRDLGLLAWPPYRLELTPAIQSGDNLIEIQVASSIHNVLGPLHKPLVPVLTTPADYVHSADWTLDYRLEPEGLAREVRLTIQSD